MLKFKSELEFIQKNNKLNAFQKRDSIFQRIKAISKIDSGLINQSKGIDTIYERFFADFPEFKKLSKAEQKLEFKRAAAIFALKHSVY